MKSFCRVLIGIGFILLMHGPKALADSLSKSNESDGAKIVNAIASASSAKTQTAPKTSYTMRYERYGVLGLYHVSLAVEILSDGVLVQRYHVDGAGRVPNYEFNLGFSKVKFHVPPAFLAGYINPKGYKQHFLGLLRSDEFGPKYTFNAEQGTKFLGMAHHALTLLNKSDKRLYLTLPFQIGPVQFWTSNSVVASLVKVANDEGIQLPDPVDGIYPGFGGPYLPKHLFIPGEEQKEDQLKFPLLGVIFFWAIIFLLLGSLIKALLIIKSKLKKKPQNQI